MSATKSQDWTVYWAISITLTSLQLTRFFFVALRPNAGQGLLIHEVSRSHTTTRHSRQDSSGRVISSSQRPLPDNTQHSQQTNIHAPGGIRTHVVSRRADADLRLRPLGSVTDVCSPTKKLHNRHTKLLKVLKIIRSSRPIFLRQG